MLRTAATIIGFLLVAFSIGFNTSRYPIVWRMTGPTAEAASTTAPPAVSQSALPASSKPIEQAKPVKEETIAIASPAIETKSLPDVAKHNEKKEEKVTANGGSPLLQAGRPSVAAPPADERFSLASTTSDKTLTPVPRVISVERFLGEPEPAELVRRLPPVDPNVASPAQDTSVLPDGAIPIYPSTGIEK